MDQGIIPYPKNSFVGYRLLTEYFTFQEKFQFIDITELENIQNKEYGDTLNIYLYLSDSDLELEQQISENNFVLGCTRSEEHTSELQSRPQLVCRRLLE